MSGVAALLLAAGSGRRMGGTGKLTAEIGGVSLVRRVAGAALESRAAPVIVVTGHEAGAVAHALAGLDVVLVDNPHHGEGLSTSIRAGVAALPDRAAGVLVLLGDMPFVTAATIDALVAAFLAAGGDRVVAPAHEGRRGNPVLWPRRFLPALAALDGDRGARDLIAGLGPDLVTVEAGDEVLVDLDTPDALAAARARLER